MIGGSEVAAVLGWSNYDDLIGVWARKTGELPERESDETMMAGRYFEDAILRWYAAKTKRIVVKPLLVAKTICGEPYESRANSIASPMIIDHAGAWAGTIAKSLLESLVVDIDADLQIRYSDDDGNVIWQSRSDRWCSLTIDGFAFDDKLGWGIVDAKNVGLRMREEWTQTVLPNEYAAQIAHYVRPCRSIAWGGFGTCVGGQELIVSDAMRESMEPLFEAIATYIPDFVETYVKPKRRPPPSSTGGGDTLKQIYPTHKPRTSRAWVGPVTTADGVAVKPFDFDERWQKTGRMLQEAYRERDFLGSVLRHVAEDANRVDLGEGVFYRFTKDNKIKRYEDR